MATSLIESMSGDFNAEEYTDEYRAALQRVIDAKVSGQEVVAPPEVEAAPSAAIDLMAALRASVERARAARAASGPPPEREPVPPTPITAAKSAKKAAQAGEGEKKAPKKAAPRKAAEEKAAKGKAATKKAAPKKAAPARRTA